jgi:hypothetical protein
VFTFLSVKSHRLCGVTSKALLEVSKQDRSWSLRSHVVGSLFGLHYSKTCDGKRAERLLEAAPPSIEADFLRAFHLILRVDFVMTVHGKLLGERAISLLTPCVAANHFLASWLLELFLLLSDSETENRTQALLRLLPELQRRCDQGDDGVAAYLLARFLALVAEDGDSTRYQPAVRLACAPAVMRIDEAAAAAMRYPDALFFFECSSAPAAPSC